MNTSLAVHKDMSAGDRMLELIRTRHPGYHPILAIADMAHDKDLDDPRLQFDCHRIILKHVSPELKSVEVKGQIEHTRRVIVSMFDGEVPLESSSTTIEQGPQITAVQGDPLWDQLILEETVAA